MSDLSAGARQALEQARRGLEPSATRLAKVQAALERATIAPSEAASGSAAGGTGGPSALKLLGAGAAFGIVAAVLTWLVARQDVRPPETQRVELPRLASNEPTRAVDPLPNHGVSPMTAPIVADRAPPAATRSASRGNRAHPRVPAARSGEGESARVITEQPVPSQAAAPSSSPDTQAPAIRVEAAPRAPAMSEDLARPAPQSYAVTKAETEKRPLDRLRDEIKLIRSARAALERGEPARALALLGEHAAQFSRGALREERMASEVMALCMSSRFDEAEQKTQALSRLPGTQVQVRELRAACPTFARRKKHEP